MRKEFKATWTNRRRVRQSALKFVHRASTLAFIRTLTEMGFMTGTPWSKPSRDEQIAADAMRRFELHLEPLWNAMFFDHYQRRIEMGYTIREVRAELGALLRTYERLELHAPSSTARRREPSSPRPPASRSTPPRG